MRTRVAGNGCFETELQGLKPLWERVAYGGAEAPPSKGEKPKEKRPKKRLSVVGEEAD
jgi:hypothetical protein